MTKIDTYLSQDIKFLNLDPKTESVLRDNNLTTVTDIWVLSRKDLKALNLKDNEIKQVTIKLQLLGLDLKKRIYR